MAVLAKLCRLFVSNLEPIRTRGPPRLLWGATLAPTTLAGWCLAVVERLSKPGKSVMGTYHGASAT